MHNDDDNGDDNFNFNVDDDGDKVNQTQPAKGPVAAVVAPTIIEEDLFVSSLSIDEKVDRWW